jgi:hypothetical protein
MSSYEAWLRRLAWRKPGYCQGGECAEIAMIDAIVALQSSTDPGTVIRYAADDRQVPGQAIEAGEFADLT